MRFSFLRKKKQQIIFFTELGCFSYFCIIFQCNFYLHSDHESTGSGENRVTALLTSSSPYCSTKVLFQNVEILSDTVVTTAPQPHCVFRIGAKIRSQYLRWFLIFFSTFILLIPVCSICTFSNASFKKISQSRKCVAIYNAMMFQSNIKKTNWIFFQEQMCNITGIHAYIFAKFSFTLNHEPRSVV